MEDPGDPDQTNQGVETLKVHLDPVPYCLVEVVRLDLGPCCLVEVVHKDQGWMSQSFPQDSQCNLRLVEVPKGDHRALAVGVPHQECGVVPVRDHESSR